MIKALALNNENTIQMIELEDINKNHLKWYWVDFNNPNDEETKLLLDLFHFHPLAVEDCIHYLQRPKLDYYQDNVFFVLHALQGDLKKEEIDFFVSKNYIVTYHKEGSIEINDVWNKILSLQKKKSLSPFSILHEVMDKLVDNYFPILYQIEDELNDIDSSSYKNMQNLLERLYEIRGSLLKLRHTINPMRDLLYRMLNSNHLEGVQERKEYFADIYDHLLKLSEMIDSNREMTADVRDSYLSLNAHLTNRNMMVLTVITTIFMPITFIAGLYGMNFEYMPELTFHYGYFIVLGFMGLISIIMYYWFKRKGWFDK